MKKTIAVPAASAVIAFALVVGFQNCSSNSLPTDTVNNASAAPDIPDLPPVIDPIPVIPIGLQYDSIVDTGSTQTLTASGGTGDFSFVVVEGTATVSKTGATTALFSAGGTVGTSKVAVTDTNGLSKMFNIRAKAPPVVVVPVVPATITYNDPGETIYTVPKFRKLTVEVWGAGGGGAGLSFINQNSGAGTSGGDGKASKAISGNNALRLIAYGGQGGTPGQVRAFNGRAGLGGAAEGGGKNTAGKKGTFGGAGGDAAGPGGGLGAKTTQQGDYAFRGPAGGVPGGGGSALSYSAPDGEAFSGGGGGGGYSIKVFNNQSDLPVGTRIRVEVGAGGDRGYTGATPSGQPGGQGRVRIVVE